MVEFFNDLSVDMICAAQRIGTQGGLVLQLSWFVYMLSSGTLQNGISNQMVGHMFK